MAQSLDINLLKAKTLLTPRLIAIDGQLRLMSVVLLILLLSTGLFFGVGYVIFRKQHETLSVGKQSLITEISRELHKEGIYSSLKDRLAIAGRIIETQRSWLGVIDLISQITASGPNTSFSVNGNNDVSLNIESDSLEDAFSVVDRLLAQVEQKHMANPILQSVEYNKDGTVDLSISFAPIF